MIMYSPGLELSQCAKIGCAVRVYRPYVLGGDERNVAEATSGACIFVRSEAPLLAEKQLTSTKVSCGRRVHVYRSLLRTYKLHRGAWFPYKNTVLMRWREVYSGGRGCETTPVHAV